MTDNNVYVMGTDGRPRNVLYSVFLAELEPKGFKLFNGVPKEGYYPQHDQTAPAREPLKKPDPALIEVSNDSYKLGIIVA